jgi:HAD superfamily hydrolase (TIGR01509 family)
MKTIILSTRAICDPTVFIWQGHKEILKRYGVNLTDEEIENMKGQALEEQINKINKRFNTNINYNDFSKESIKLSKELIKQNLTPFPHTKEILEDLKSKNIKIILASQNKKSNLHFYLQTMEIEKYFDGIISIEDIQKFKPHPEILELAYKKFNNTPEECLFIDKRTDSIETAKNLGIQTIHFKDSTQLKEDIELLVANN